MNLAELDKEIEMLSEELSKLNVQYEAQKKDNNFSDEFIAEKRKEIESGNIPKDLQESIEQSKLDAKKAGEARKAILNSANNNASTRKSRQGAMRV